jgi:hypothetical protein
MDAGTFNVTHSGDPHSTVLVAIDQHAADERVRVESLMKEMCICSSTASDTNDTSVGGTHAASLQPLEHQLDTMAMIPPLPITLSKREWRLAAQYSDWLSRWGIALERNVTSNAAVPQSQEESVLGDDMGDAILVSHHFSDSFSMTSQNDQHPSERVPGETAATRMIPGASAVYATASDYIHGWVTVLPRVVADRCVVDGTLTQDLIKDSISWAEESRYSSRQDLPRPGDPNDSKNLHS